MLMCLIGLSGSHYKHIIAVKYQDNFA